MSISREARFCAQLTGMPEVAARLAASVLSAVGREAGANRVEAMLSMFDHEGLQAVLADRSFKTLCQHVTYAMYVGSPLTPRAEAPPEEDYFEALVWRVIQAHPPALSGAYYGHWRYPPEDAP